MTAVLLMILPPFIIGKTQKGNEVEATPTIVRASSPTPTKVSKLRPIETHHSENLGEFVLTAYCPCFECCGKFEEDPWYGITASGTKATENHTVAVDPEVIPLGSILYINGVRYVAEDVGGAIEGNHVDIFFNDHQKALEFGVQQADVFIWR